MKTRRFFPMVFGIVVLVLLLLAYGKQAPAKEVIKLKFSTWTAVTGAAGKASMLFLDDIESRSGGKVKFERYSMGSLIPATREAEAVGKGMADIAMVLSSFTYNRLPLIHVTALPGVISPLETHGPNVVELAKMQAIQEDFAEDNLVLLAVHGGDPGALISKKPIRKMDELKGLKIFAHGPDEARTLANLGAVGVGLTTPEAYEALERGTIDAVNLPPLAHKVFRIYEVGKYYTEFPLYTSTLFIMMNRKSWLALPDDIKAIFKQRAAEEPQKFIENYHIEYKEVFKQIFPKAGLEVIKMPASDLAKITQAAMPVWEIWAKKQEKAGKPGREVLNRWLEIRGLKR